MRLTLTGMVMATMAAALFIASPFWTAWGLREAIRTGNSTHLERKIEWDSVRTTLKASLAQHAKLVPEITADDAVTKPGLWQRVKIALGRAQEAMGDAATAAAMAENDKEAQALVQEVTVATALGLANSGQVDLAIQDLTALRDKDPDLAAARLGLGRALVMKRQPDAAIVELKKAVELDPQNAEAWYQLGYASYALKQDAPGALPAFEKAVAGDPGNVGYRTFLGAVLSDTGQGDRAVQELTKVTGTPGYNRADAWIYLGEAHLGAKRYKDAIPALDKALTIAPDSAPAEAYLGWCYFGLKDAVNFKKHAGKAKALVSGDGDLLALAGQWLLGLLAGAKRDTNFFYQLLGILTKPFDPRTLSDDVRALVTGWAGA